MNGTRRIVRTLTTIMVGVVLVVMLASPAPARQQTIVCRDARGVRTGTVEIMKNGDAVFRNRHGVRVGTARVMGNRTVFYDRSGRRTGEMSGASFPLLGCGGTGP